MSPHGLGQPEEAFWHSTPREVAARLDGLSMLLSGDKQAEAQEQADGLVALAAASGPVETIKVAKIIRLDDRRG